MVKYAVDAPGALTGLVRFEGKSTLSNLPQVRDHLANSREMGMLLDQ